MNGRGIARSRASPSATAIPENTTARPGGLHRPHDRVVDGLPEGELLPEAVDDEQRVVDGDPEPDQLHEVRRVRRRRPDARDPVDDPERAADRAGGEDQRDRHGPRQAEDEQQDDQGDRHGDQQLAVLEVAVEDGIEVVLDRGCTGDVDLPHPRRPAERGAHLIGVRLRLREVQGRLDVAVDDRRPIRCARKVELGRRSARHDRSGPLDGRGEARLHRGRIGRRTRLQLEDDGERPVRTVAEVLLEHLANLLGFGARHREGVREDRRELRARKASHEERDDPEREHRAAVRNDESRPAGHGSQRYRRPT